ncbi:MAG: Uncharacterised protein [SAR116 cluster bacterium]|nr:MAG: Uncharacterised protein [SAR116 cluster bacterium]
MHDQKPANLNIMCQLAHLDLHGFAIRQPDAKTLAPLDIFSSNFHRPLGEAQPAHTVRQARRAKADLCDLQSVPFFHQPVIRIDFQPVKADLAMPAMLFRTHDRNTAFNVPPRLVFVEQKGRKAFSRIVRGARH